MDTRIGIKQVKLEPDYSLMQFAISKGLMARLEEEARRLKVSKSEIVRRACELYLSIPILIRHDGDV
jgi:hypothetical protein